MLDREKDKITPPPEPRRLLEEAEASIELPEAPQDSPVSKAWALADQGKLTEAEVEFSKAIVRGEDGAALLEYGRFLVRTGRLDQAIVMFERSLSLAQEQDDQIGKSRGYGNLGIVLRTRGDLDGAEEMHRKALEIEKKLGRLEGMAANYGNLGLVLQTRGDLDGAEEMYRKSLEIEEKLGRLEGMANQYGNLGIVLRTRGDLDGAEEMFRKALEVAKKLGAQPLIEKIQAALGSLGKDE